MIPTMVFEVEVSIASEIVIALDLASEHLLD